MIWKDRISCSAAGEVPDMPICCTSECRKLPPLTRRKQHLRGPENLPLIIRLRIRIIRIPYRITVTEVTVYERIA